MQKHWWHVSFFKNKWLPLLGSIALRNRGLCSGVPVWQRDGRAEASGDTCSLGVTITRTCRSMDATAWGDSISQWSSKGKVKELLMLTLGRGKWSDFPDVFIIWVYMTGFVSPSGEMVLNMSTSFQGVCMRCLEIIMVPRGWSRQHWGLLSFNQLIISLHPILKLEKNLMSANRILRLRHYLPPQLPFVLMLIWWKAKEHVAQCDNTW